MTATSTILKMKIRETETIVNNGIYKYTYKFSLNFYCCKCALYSSLENNLLIIILFTLFHMIFVLSF